MPAGLFRVVMQKNDPPESALVHIDVERGVAIQQSKQPTLNLLCGDCELRFSQGGENTVIAECQHGLKGFDLRGALQSIPATQVSQGRSAWFGSSLGGVDAAAYLYFAVSIVWRGSVVDWGGPYRHSFNTLGEAYQEAFRLYLLGEAALPPAVALMAYVNFTDGYDLPAGFVIPPKMKMDGVGVLRFWTHSFFIPGIRILLSVGGDAAHLTHGAAPADRCTFFEWHMNGTDFHAGLARRSRAVEAKGKLAKKN